MKPVWSGVAIAGLLAGCGGSERSAEDATQVPVEPPQRAQFAELDCAAVRLSPDGERLAFLAPVDSGQGVWLAEGGDIAAAEPVSGAEAHRADGLWWSYASDLLYRRVDDEGESNELWVLEVGSDQPRALTPEGRATQLLHLSPAHPDEVVVAVADATDATRDVHRISLRDEESDVLAEGEPFADWGVDDDLDLRLAFETVQDGGLRVRKKAETGEWADFSWVPLADAARARFLGFDITAQRAFFFDSRGRDTVALVESDMTTGEARVLFQDPGVDASDVLRHPVERSIQAVAAGDWPKQWWVLDEAVREDVERLRSVADGALEIVDRALDDSVWLAAITPWDGPRRFYRYEREGGEVELLFTGLPPAALEAESPDAPTDR